ncbi:hypothetical protein [Thiohalorhabdus methylotrophus]|uniref:HPt domain-containing protein n=1 Tax=Thiohalorhabdus methylotrophus TaxID=3242694 RepID=A0ABV4TU58_9GAMM
MATAHLDAQELAITAWFVESAVVSLKEYLEEDAEEGVEDALRVRDLYLLEGIRSLLQGHLGSAESVSLELSAEQLERLSRLADDAAALCRGQRPGTEEMQALSTPPDASALAHILEGLRDKLRAHPEHPELDG